MDSLPRPAAAVAADLARGWSAVSLQARSRCDAGGFGDRTITIGDVICFELAYDKTVYSALTGGAQLLLVQSNNATYGGTGQIRGNNSRSPGEGHGGPCGDRCGDHQQCLRSHRFTGRIVERTNEFTAASTVVACRCAPDHAGVRLAPWIDRLLAAAGLLCCVLAAAGARGPAGGLGNRCARMDRTFHLTAQRPRHR